MREIAFDRRIVYGLARHGAYYTRIGLALLTARGGTPGRTTAAGY